MKVVITGLANSGKTAIFNALTGQRAETTPYPSTGGAPNVGVVKVPDERVDRLSAIFKPKKTTYAAVEYVDYAGLTKGDPKHNKSVFDLVKDADALVHVARAFEDASVMHPLGGIDPVRDVKAVESELLFGDFELVEKRLESIEQMAKKGKKPPEDEKRVLLKCREALEKELPLRLLALTEDELKAIRHMQFYTMKPEVVVINTGEGDLNSAQAQEAEAEIKSILGAYASVITLCGKIEMELSELPPGEAKAFLEDLGISEPASKRLIQATYTLLGLISFLTTGEDEVRAWTISRGITALKAAGKIHSDIEKGFIRAEVISYDDFMSVGGDMSLARSKGVLRLEGKTYEVKDGDIINFRFSV